MWGVCVYFIDIASIWASISMHVYMGSGCLQGICRHDHIMSLTCVLEYLSMGL